jgi:hypothetical protein
MILSQKDYLEINKILLYFEQINFKISIFKLLNIVCIYHRMISITSD